MASVGSVKAWRDENTLRYLYQQRGYTQREIAHRLDCSRTTIKTWFRKHDIDATKTQYEMPENDLREWYLEDGLSISDIAERIGCSYLAVRNRLQNYNIPLRPTGGSPPEDADMRYRNEGELRRLYHDEELSKGEIAEKCNVTESTIQSWMNRHGIEARDYSNAQHNRREGNSYRDKETLERLYWGEGLTQREIADKLDCGFVTVQKWMNEYDIDLRYAGANGQTYETDRGEYVRSAGERTIANWFYHHGIDYTYEPDGPNVSLIPDFKVGDVLIEYWGMVANEDYRERMAEKKDVYNGLDVEVVDLYPDDLGNLSAALGRFADG